MPKTKVHRIRFYEPDTLSSINSISINEEHKKLALMRRTLSKDAFNRSSSNSTIEIWNIDIVKSPFLEAVIPDNDDAPTLLESVLWGPGGRLFSCGLNGNFNEYDLSRKSIKQSYAVGTGAIWCMCFNRARDHIVFGTNEGTIAVYDLDTSHGDNVNFVKTCAKWNDRILSIHWYEDVINNVIITGSKGTISIWSYSSGRCMETMRVGKDIMVWCLDVLQNFIIVSGDSSGATTFWDGKTATMKESFKSHQADVLCLCQGNEKNVFSSGVDPIIHQFKVHFDGKIVVQPPLRNHTHDVRSLRFLKSGMLYSGGLDSYLMQTSFTKPMTFIRYSQDFSKHIHSFKNLCLLQYLMGIEIWQLPMESDNSISDTPVKLATIASKRQIIASALSEKWICYARFKGLVVLHRTAEKLEKVPLIGESSARPYDRLEILNETILCACSGMQANIYRLDPAGILLEKSLKVKTIIHQVKILPKVLIIVSENGAASLFSTSSWSEINKVDLGGPVVALELNPFQSNELWIALANKKLVMLDVESMVIKKKLQCSSFGDVNECFRGIAFTSKSLVVYDQNDLYSIGLPRGELRATDTTYRHILKIGTLPSDDLFVVEMTPEMLFRKLPPLLKKKRFNT
ncbi:U3 small nucleolar RNA-associated protein 4 [Halotydeus destructor]|nr:U3 small nucleolar RNA-associated protein 4 [Halotydeus destructor]